MIKNYFRIAWRNLIRNRSFAFINILGLSLGIACAILIFTVVTYHFSTDNFHPGPDRIYRIVSEFHYESTELQSGVPEPLGKAFRNDFSFAETTARIIQYGDVTISLPGEKEVKKFHEEDLAAFAEPSFFDIFNFPLVKGNKQTALAAPNTAIITQKIARKYFGTEEALGKIIRMTAGDSKADFTISGILKDIPANTDHRQEIYLSYINLKTYNPRFANDSTWGSVSSAMNCFVRLKPGISKATVDNAFPAFVKKYYDAADAKATFFRLQPLSDIHFNMDLDGYADKKYLWALAWIGLFLIVTACVNFVNLSTAQALNRSKEVGVRKVLGSLRSQLFWQFMAETFLITLFAVALAFGLAKAALPWLNTTFKEELTLTLWKNWQQPVFLVLLSTLVVFLSGSYPAMILARFRPALALKGKLSQRHIGGFSLRRVLVVTQFALSQMLIIGMIVIAGQMRYSKSSDLGFNKDAVLILPVPLTDKTKMNTLKARLSDVAGVEKVSLFFEPPASQSNSFTDFRYDNHAKEETWDIGLKPADAQYVPAFDLKLVAGRNLFPSDSIRECLVNEIVIRKLGLASPREAIGKKLNFNGGKLSIPIAGVVKDFYNNSFHSAITPLCMMSGYRKYRNCAVKLNRAEARPALEAFQKIWNETYPDYVYTSQFLDEKIEKFYQMDTIMLRLLEGFAGIAILIGCLGLYGLVSFMALQKTKEIGVRKVLGATIPNILWLYGKEFTRLLLIAFVIAAPLAWLAMHKWLQDFVYRIPINAEIFLLAISFTFIVAALTVGYRSMRSALANPVKSLRSE
jgi:putative ABC transport system permease protein